MRLPLKESLKRYDTLHCSSCATYIELQKHLACVHTIQSSEGYNISPQICFKQYLLH